MEISLDFETFSEVDLFKTGLSRYAMDPSTEILCMSYAIDGGPVRSWHPGRPFPLDLQVALRKKPQMWAWNASFEYQIWKYVGPRFGFPPVPDLGYWRDTMALACYFGLPAALAAASRVMGGAEKSATGVNLIRLLCGPCKPSKKFNKSRRTTGTHPDLFDELYRYCNDDVTAEMGVRDLLPRRELPTVEQRIWFMNAEANHRGVGVDMALVDTLTGIRDTHTESLVEEFKRLAGGLEPSQTAAVKDYLLDEYLIDLPNLQKETIENALADESIAATPRRLLEIRASASQVAGKKLDAIKRVGDLDARLRDLTFYYGAGTGRFAGRLVQLQNLARGRFKVSDQDPEILKGLSPEDALLLYGIDPMEIVGTMIRPCIVSDPGMDMYDADFNAIEARILAWWAGENALVNAFAQGQDVYKLMATDIYHIPPEAINKDQRFVGKTAVLGCGFQAAGEKFRDMCIGYGIDISQEDADLVVEKYRARNQRIVKSWKDAQESFMAAIRKPNSIVFLNGCKISSNVKYLFVQLPSGRTITYCQPSIETVTKVFKKEEGPKRIQQITYWGVDSLTRRWGKQTLYGGKIVENLVQGMARDLMCHAMDNVVRAGYQLLFHVHDQVICQHKEGGSLDRYIQLMTSKPQWAQGLPVAAEGKICKRFSK